MKKVVFTQINPLKNEIIDKKYKGLKFNYKINDIGEDYHIGTFLKDVPPQF
ncbi:MAG: hypothetical protein IPH89_12575 [Bacteroidetes bacterium]|nr:hypothetical protein [Bacteroidota bacterium]